MSKKQYSLKDNSKQVEQLVELKDGRKVFKTDNGFTSWVEDQKGKVTKVTNDYYKKAIKKRK